MIKKGYILSGFLLLAIFGSIAYSAPRFRIHVTPEFRNDGDTRAGINVSIDSSTWTQVLSASSTRRATIINTVASSPEVCLSTITTSSVDCNSSTPGYHLEASIQYWDYSNAPLYARVKAASSTTTIYGMMYSDSGD